MADDTFEIGLVMAGAVSAGAYTAGVLDFLIEALDEWEAAKASAPGMVPPHNFKIKVITGASAGSLVAAIFTGGLTLRFPPMRQIVARGNRDLTGNPLFDAWVQGAGIKDLLQTDDLDTYQNVVPSLLFSEPVRRSLENALAKAVADAKGKPLAERPYVMDPLPIHMAVTNLAGVPYRVGFDGDDTSGHTMWQHGEIRQFYIGRQEAPELKADGAVRIDPDVPYPGGAWPRLVTSALTSGAFPLGLAPQTFTRPLAEINDRAWPVTVRDDELKEPLPRVDKFDQPIECEATRSKPVDSLLGQPDYTFFYVDGGVINNEPFDIAHKVLKGGDAFNERAPDKARRAVLMVDPFPDPFEPATYNKLKAHVLDLVGPIVSAMKNQSRFKPKELELAADPTVYSRFMIAPVRYGAGNGPRQRIALAGGGLAAFGGALDHGFRLHDFYLGRRNCQQFLRKYFVLADTNPLFKNWSAADRARYGRHADPGFLPIVPLAGDMDDNVPEYPWPAYPEADLPGLGKDVAGRLDAVVRNLANAHTKGVWRAVILLAAKVAKGFLASKVMGMIKKDMVERGQLPKSVLKPDESDDDLHAVG